MRLFIIFGVLFVRLYCKYTTLFVYSKHFWLKNAVIDKVFLITDNRVSMEKSMKIRKVVDYLRYNNFISSQQNLAEKLVVNRSTLSSAINGNEKYMDTVIRKLLFVFPDINPDFLLGDSEVMMKSDAESVTPRNAITGEPIEAKEVDAEEVADTAVSVIPRRIFNKPEVDVYEYAEENKKNLPTLEVANILEGVQIAIHPSDDSMYPNIYANDYLLVRRVPQGARITDGKVYYINTHSRGGFVRRFYQHGEGKEAYFEGLADNAEVFPPAKIAMDDIISISAIICILRKDIHAPADRSHSKQIEQSNAHISQLITEIGKAGERAGKAGERTDRLIEMMMEQMKK